MKKIVCTVVIIVIVVFCAFLWLNRTLKYTSEDYNFSFNCSADYKEIYSEKAVYSFKNYDKGIVLNVTAMRNNGKKNKDISELGNGYVNMLKIYNEEAKYEILKDETIKISDEKVDAREVIVKITEKDSCQIDRTILIPVDDREITFMFRGNEKNMQENTQNIDKVIKSIRIF